MPSSSSARARCVISRMRGDRRRAREAFADRRDAVRREAEAVHAGVDLDEDLERARQHRAFEHRGLLLRMDDGREPALRELGEFALVEEALDQQDATRVQALAQRRRGLELDQRQAVGVVQRRQHALEPVAVRVRLDHRQDLGARRRLARTPQVRPQGRQVDLRVERAGHGVVGAAHRARRACVARRVMGSPVNRGINRAVARLPNEARIIPKGRPRRPSPRDDRGNDGPRFRDGRRPDLRGDCACVLHPPDRSWPDAPLPPTAPARRPAGIRP